MRPLKILILFVISATILSACSTGQNAYKRGNYYDATLQAVRNLRVNPTSKKSISLVQKSYPMALNYYRQKVDIELSSNNPNKYLNTVEHYTKLNTLADEISRCPAALNVIKPVVYFNEQLKKAEQLAVKEQFSLAQQLLGSHNIADARIALYKLEWIKGTDPNYPNLTGNLNLAENLATLKVVVEDYPANSKGLPINSKVFYHRLFDEVKRQNEKRLLRFYKPDLAEELSLKPHEIVAVQFIDFSIGTLLQKEKTSSYKSDSVKVGTYKDNNNVVHDVFGIVKADVTLYEREMPVRGILRITIKNFETGQTITTQQFPGEFIWRNDWASFNGDERAVPTDLKKAIREKQRNIPSPQEMFLVLSEPMMGQAVSFLSSYYRKK